MLSKTSNTESSESLSYAEKIDLYFQGLYYKSNQFRQKEMPLYTLIGWSWRITSLDHQNSTCLAKWPSLYAGHANFLRWNLWLAGCTTNRNIAWTSAWLYRLFGLGFLSEWLWEHFVCSLRWCETKWITTGPWCLLVLKLLCLLGQARPLLESILASSCILTGLVVAAVAALMRLHQWLLFLDELGDRVPSLVSYWLEISFDCAIGFQIC